MARLVVQDGENKGMSFEIRGGKFSIGRDLSNDVQLLYPKVSRLHAEVRFDKGEYVIRDMESRNGTTVNGLAVESAILEHGDTVGVGDTLFVFTRDDTDITGFDHDIFGETHESLETVLDTVPSWNVDLLKKNLIASSHLEFQDIKRYLVELYDLSRRLAEFDDERALLQHAGGIIRDVIHADRVFPALRSTSAKDGWEIVPVGDVTSAVSLTTTRISRTAFDRAAAERVSLITHLDVVEEPSASMVKYDIHTTLAVPVAAEGDQGAIVAMLYADRLGGGENFTRIELEFVTACALAVSDAFRELAKVRGLRQREQVLRKEVRSRYNIVGTSRPVREMLEFIQKAGASESVVLIMGESGTGKELVARAIHYVSPRSEGVFRTINCAAISETLLESELFGHVKGAFTGAEGDKPGVFEIADGGTLFLDEIGEMSATGQAKLLRVIEQGEICRVGGTEVKKVDVRVIAATNKDLERETSKGTFREDLYHRLNILPIVVAPLRDRKGDVKVLLDYFTEYFSAECGRKLTFNPEAVGLLEAYPWPGNIRELRNFVERTFILASGDEIGRDSLPAKILYSSAAVAGDLTLEAAIRAHILKVLDTVEGNKKRAAEILGIDRSTLYARLGAIEKEQES